MPRTKISEYSTTNSDNTDIESININEGCAPSGINNAIRELMVHLKEFQTGASSDPLTVAGTFVASGGATIAASAGTSASPSIHFSSDTNTGIFSPAADTIAFAEGGVEAMRIDSSGNVGIGTTSPDATLQVLRAATTGEYLRVGANSGAPERSLRFSTFTVGGTVDVGHLINAPGNVSSAAGTLAFATNSTEHMRITSAGEVLVGGTTSVDTVPSLSIQGTGSGSLGGAGRLNLYRPDTTVTSGEAFGLVGFYGNDTTSNTPTNLAYIAALASGTHAAGDNPTDLVFGTTPDGSATVTEAMRIDSGGNLEFNSGYGSVATAYGCRAWVNFNGAANTNLSGTYSQSGTTVTVTATAHGLIAGNVVYSDITSGTGVDGTYTVATVTSSSVFTYTAGTSLTTSGNITLRRSTIRASGNVSSVADNSTGDYTINFSVAMPDENYSLVGACGAQSVSTGAGNYSLGIPGISSFFTANGVKIQTWSTSNTQTDCFFINAAIFR